VDVVSKTKAETLASHCANDDAFYLDLGFNIPYGWIYNLSQVELRIIKASTVMNISNGFIQQ